MMSKQQPETKPPFPVDLLPGIGLVLGAGSGMGLGVALAGGPGIALGIAIGASLGLLVGAVIRMLSRSPRL